MKRHLFFLISLLLLLTISIFAQESQKDSLLNVLSSAQDTTRVNTLNALCDLLYRTDPAEAIHYGDEARELAEKLNYQKGLAYALKNLGLGYYFQGNYVEASIHWEQSLSLLESLQDNLGAANLMSNLGAIYSMSAEEAKATEYFLKALKIGEEYGDSLRMATALLNMGVIYSAQPVTRDQAVGYYRQALNISELINYLDGMGMSTYNLGEIYFQEGNNDSALYYFEKSMQLYEHTIDIVSSINYIGRVYAENGDFQTALQYQQEALKIAEKAESKLEMAQIFLGLADTYQKQGNLKLAITYFDHAKDIAREMEANYEIKDSYEGLARTYAQLSDFRNAYTYQSLVSDIEKTIYNIETDDKIKTLQFSYQLEKKEDEIEILEQQSEIEQLKIKRQRVVTIATGATGILLLVLAVVLYNRFQYTQKTKKIIEKEKDRSDHLLLNILPEKTAEELKAKGKAKARRYEMVSILFTDFKEFTRIAADLDPEVLVNEVNQCYVKFDEIISRNGIEKIKTIGDAYMAAGGLPVPNDTHAQDVVKAAYEIRDYMLQLKAEREKENKLFFEIRVGIHTGPVVAGIVGTKKFAYDIWGDTVNIAARMESTSEPGKINISECTYNLIKDHYHCKFRGEIEVKNRGKLKMYFVGKERKIIHPVEKEVNLIKH